MIIVNIITDKLYIHIYLRIINLRYLKYAKNTEDYYYFVNNSK